MRLSVLTDVHLLSESQEEISALIGKPIVFPEKSHSSIDTLIRLTNDAELILISPSTVIDAKYLDACTTVKHIAICGSAKDNVDLKECKNRNIEISNVINYGDEPTAEFMFMQLTSLLRGVNGQQWKLEPHELMGKRIGIIGLGALGQAIAHLALAYKMKVSYFSPHRKLDWEAKGLTYINLDSLLSSSEIIALTGPSNKMLLKSDDFRVIPNGTILLQGSMGDVFDPVAFLKWIKRAGNFAIFDYAAGEKNYHAYAHLDRVIFPRVVAGHSHETRHRLGQGVLNNIDRYMKNKENTQIK
jgi:hypothetical protein